MSPEQIQILTVVLGAIAGLLPILLTAIFSGIDKRSAIAQRTQALTMAQQRVEFLNAWIEAQEKLCTKERFEEVKAAVSAELLQIKEHLNDILETQQNRPHESVIDKHFIQKLFLIYLPRNVMSWVWHTLFYMALGATAISLLLLLAPTDITEVEGVLIVFSLPSIVAAIIFHQAAAAVDRKADLDIVTRLNEKAARNAAAGQ